MAKRRQPSVQERLLRVESAIRKEHDEVVAALQKLDRHTHDLDIQFKRIAQMQAELDSLKREWQRMQSLRWQCPACRIEIQHGPLDGLPDPKRNYRCHTCQLDLRFDLKSDRMIPVPIYPDAKPARVLPSQLDRSHKLRRRVR